MKTRMCNLKKEFLKKWMKGLRAYTESNTGESSVLDRKRAIKLSADLAMASTRKSSTHWSQALMDDISSSTNGHTTNKTHIVEEILGHKVSKATNTGLITTSSKKILRRIRSRKVARVVPRVKASSIARKIVKSKTRVLKSLVPGGEKMDESCLIRETLDYIVSLRAQVDVMRLLANVVEGLDSTPRRSD